MPTAATSVINAPNPPRQAMSVTLLPTVAAVDDGDWIDTLDYCEGSVHVTIVTTATVQLRGSDAATKPANTAHGDQIGSDITASALLDVKRLPRWTKARVSAWTSGNVTVNSTLRRPGR